MAGKRFILSRQIPPPFSPPPPEELEKYPVRPLEVIVGRNFPNRPSPLLRTLPLPLPAIDCKPTCLLESFKSTVQRTFWQNISFSPPDYRVVQSAFTPFPLPGKRSWPSLSLFCRSLTHASFSPGRLTGSFSPQWADPFLCYSSSHCDVFTSPFLFTQ